MIAKRQEHLFRCIRYRLDRAQVLYRNGEIDKADREIEMAREAADLLEAECRKETAREMDATGI